MLTVVTCNDSCWPVLTCFDLCWDELTWVDPCWHWLTCVDLSCPVLNPVDLYLSQLTCVDVIRLVLAWVGLSLLPGEKCDQQHLFYILWSDYQRGGTGFAAWRITSRWTTFVRWWAYRNIGDASHSAPHRNRKSAVDITISCKKLEVSCLCN